MLNSYFHSTLLAVGNPFVNAYVGSDWFGKGLFFALFGLSVISWIVLVHKAWSTYQIFQFSKAFSSLLSEKRDDPLALQLSRPTSSHPFFEIYKTFKQSTLQLLQRAPSLSQEDLNLIEAQVSMAIATQAKEIDKNLFVLSTAVTLAPFLGLLGTVWGILVTFSQMHAKGAAINNAALLAGLSLALTTTVLGLVIAIPALLGYNILKNKHREYRRDMEQFSRHLLSSAELKYRKSL